MRCKLDFVFDTFHFFPTVNFHASICAFNSTSNNQTKEVMTYLEQPSPTSKAHD